MDAFGERVGAAVGTVLVGLVFVLVMVPLGVAMRLARVDPPWVGRRRRAAGRRGGRSRMRTATCTCRNGPDHARPGAALPEPPMLKVLRELVRFVVRRRKYWLIPLLVTLVFFAALIVLSMKAGPAAPFIYPLF